MRVSGTYRARALACVLLWRAVKTCRTLRGLVLCTLLLALPFGGMHVVCVAAPEDADPGISATTHGDLSDCERLCPLHESTESASADEYSTCALSAGASSLMASSSLAVMRPLDPPLPPRGERTVYVESPRFVPEPVLPHFVPPPKSDTV